MSSEAKPSILVVEDENVVAMDLVASLEKLQYGVAGVAASGEEAVELARSRQPSLVLMDIHLRGGMDGISAAEQIREKLLIPVVYLTAYSDEATLNRARVTHPFGYLLKPFEEREVEVAIQMALFRHKTEQALRDNERRLDAILRSIGDAVIATDTHHRITFLNRSAENLLGWRAERARGRLLADVMRVSSEQVEGIHVLQQNDRDEVPIELVQSSVLDNSGKPTGYVTVVRDVSERLRAQRAHEREMVERAARAAAEREHERARIKSECSLILADLQEPLDMASALDRVAELLVPNLADVCAFHHLEGPQDRARIVACVDPVTRAWAEELHEHWSPDAPRGFSVVARTGQAELLESVSERDLVEIANGSEQVEALGRGRMKSYLCVPLRARQRIVGALSLIWTKAGRRYDLYDLMFAQQLADRVATSIENVRLYREAEEARISAERLYQAERRARAEAEALFRVADALTETQLDLDALVQKVTDEATALVGASFGAFFYNVCSETGGAYMLYTLSGASRESFEGFGLPRNTPLFGPTFRGEAVVRIDDVRQDPRYGTLAPHYGMPKGHLPVSSYLAVPVVSRTGAVIGGLFLGHPEPAQFTEQHERMAKALAAHAAVAIDNARLFGETRAAEKRQRKLVQELERTVRFSEMFVGILGHDLRNPLSGITTAASLIQNRAESDRIAKPIGRILNSAGRMSRMIDQILDFTHVRLGRGIPLDRRTTDLVEICRMVLDELKSGSDHGSDLRLEVQGDACGSWDADRLSQLVSNLAGNAVQHRLQGTPVTVTIDGLHPERVRLEIHNRGHIPAETLSVIFEPLRTGEYRKREGASGLGLGLYISQQVAMAHGGLLRAASEPEDGTRFSVELPRMPPGEPDQVFSSGGEENRRV